MSWLWMLFGQFNMSVTYIHDFVGTSRRDELD
jgi:hypothetical protein